MQIELEDSDLRLHLASDEIEPVQHFQQTSTLSLLSGILPDVQFEFARVVEEGSTLVIDLRTGLEEARLREGGLVLDVAGADVTR